MDEQQIDSRPVGQFAYRCEACGRTDVLNPGTHESIQHDGAQTCWPMVCRPTGATIRDGRARLDCGSVSNPAGYCCEHGAHVVDDAYATLTAEVSANLAAATR